MMPNGHIFFAADHPLFNGPTSVFECDPTANVGVGSYPNVTLGLTYMDMEKTNAQTPKTASGFDLMLNCPAELDPAQLEELHLAIVLPKEDPS